MRISMKIVLPIVLALGLASGATAGPPRPLPYPLQLSPCARAEVNGDETQGVSAVGIAQASNRLEDYRAFLDQFPQSVCAEDARAYVDRRSAAAARIASAPKVPAPKPTPLIPISDIVMPDDYPPVAIRNREEGVSTVEWNVMPDGYVENCRVVNSSGSAILDLVTCRIITRRMRYDPARDNNGAPMQSTQRVSLRWQIPTDKPPPHPN